MTVYGIDLGTTYSVISYVDETGSPTIVKNRRGDDATPSVVYFKSPYSVVVGAEAKNAALSDNELVVSLIKRKMGVKDVEFEFHGQSYRPESVSALILKDLAGSVAAVRGEEAREVVITVPAYFGVAEREATKLAGEMAGLTVVNLVPEPVAAALYYGVLNSGAERTILVYDLGGGTFDTTVIHLSGNDVTVICTDGDHQLGGADWDDRIVGYLRDAFVAQHPDSGADDSEEFLQDLGIEAEDLKKALSGRQARRQVMRFEGRTAKAELTRAAFQQISADLLERTMMITARTIREAQQRGYGRIDDVLLVGGSTRMPAVATALERRLGITPKVHEPDLAVAKGAAMFALRESLRVGTQDGKAPDTQPNVTIVIPRAFGVKHLAADALEDSDEKTFQVRHLLMANTPLPAPPVTEQFVTAHEGQNAIEVEIWEQAGAVVSAQLEHNTKIGDGLIKRLPKLPKGSPIHITFSMDESGVLSVRAIEMVTGQSIDIELQIGDLTPKQVAAARDTVSRLSSDGV